MPAPIAADLSKKSYVQSTQFPLEWLILHCIYFHSSNYITTVQIYCTFKEATICAQGHKCHTPTRYEYTDKEGQTWQSSNIWTWWRSYKGTFFNNICISNSEIYIMGYYLSMKEARIVKWDIAHLLPIKNVEYGDTDAVSDTARHCHFLFMGEGSNIS